MPFASYMNSYCFSVPQYTTFACDWSRYSAIHCKENPTNLTNQNSSTQSNHSEQHLLFGQALALTLRLSKYLHRIYVK